jgi:hypothetical protein
LLNGISPIVISKEQIFNIISAFKKQQKYEKEDDGLDKGITANNASAANWLVGQLEKQHKICFIM